MNERSFLPTRRSLVERLADPGDQRRWSEFFQTYHRLIFQTALRAGLREAEAEEVVQETLITVSRNIGKLRYDPAEGSFKGWLLTITRWRIVDQFRKRDPALVDAPTARDETPRTAAIDRLPQEDQFASIWEEEWRKQVLDAAVSVLKRRVEPRQWQVFDCYVLKGWPARKVAAELRVNLAQVYLVKNRLGAALKAEVQRLERGNVQ